MSRKERRAEKSSKGHSALVTAFNRALELQQAGRIAEAIDFYLKAKAINPNVALLHNNLGVAYYDLGRFEEAIASQQQAIKLDPTMGMSYNNLGVALNALQAHGEAIKYFSRAIEIEPTNAQAVNNLGDSYVKLSRFEEGEAALRRSLAIQPDYVEAYTNLGAALWGLGRLDEAVGCFRRVIALQPEVAMAHKNLGIVSLLIGSYAEGWREYDWRWRADKIPMRLTSKPLWLGQALREGAVYVWNEQGVGDQILHASMLPDMAARGLKVIWETDERLVGLLQRSCPDAKIVPRVGASEGGDSPEVAAQIAAGSVGNYFRADIAQFPTAERAAYLRADSARAAAYRASFSLAPGEKLVGMSWLSKNFRFGESKSTTLAAWTEILRTPGIRFVDLQYGDTAEERAAFAAQSGIKLEHVEGLDLYNDLDGLAALIEACDLVVTVSNTTAHIAGGLGKPVWILIADGIGKFWYWGFDAATSRWYPSARLIRQPASQDWSPSLRTIADRLAMFIREG